MKKFSEFKVGDEFFSTCSISEKELTEYLKFSRIKNAFLEDMQNTKQKLVSGRAIISRMEGEFTRLSQIYGNHIIFVGTDGEFGKIAIDYEGTKQDGEIVVITKRNWYRIKKTVSK